MKIYNQISVGLLEMSSGTKSMKSMKSSRKTRRSSRQVVLDELELVMRRLEQIKNMVDKHCVAPPRSQIVAHLQSKPQAQQELQAQAEAEAGAGPLTPVQEEEEGVASVVADAADAALAAEEEEPEAESDSSKLALAVEPAPAIKRKSGGCPGGPKAYNEFVKKWLAEQRDAGIEMTYQQALKEIKEKNIYTQSCGLPPKKNKTRKLPKVPQTPARVNAPYVPYVQTSPNASSLSAAAASLASAPAAASLASAPRVKERGKSLPPTAANLAKQESEREYLEKGIASRRAAREAEAQGLPPVEEEGSNAASSSPSSLAPAATSPSGYKDLGMDDTLGMRKISVNGRKLLMTNGNSGLFEDKDGAPGDFVGYLRNGKVEESSPPEV